jgi:hypothetical protein
MQTPETKERWRHLAEQIAIEEDSDKFLELIRELNGMLEAKRNRLNTVRDKQRESALAAIPKEQK